MTLIIAHRGASAYAPENTLAAFALAHAQGAHMLELDVQRTADGVLVVFHDETTERWNSQPCPVRTCTLADMQQLSIGGEQVPTLEAVCRFASQCGIGLNIELKQPDIVEQTVALLHTYQLADTTLISSFFEPALHTLRRCAPHIRRGYLMGLRTLRPDIRLRELWPFFHLQLVRATAWHPNVQLPLLRVVLPLVRRAGYHVFVWTVDDPAALHTWVRLGASGIITNRPDLAYAVVSNSTSNVT